MNVISTTLKLTCSPISVRDIAWAKNDADVQNAIKNAHVYMIAKKPQILFSNIKIDGNKIDLDLVNVCGRVGISIPMDQSIFKPCDKKVFVFDVGSKENQILVKGDSAATAHEMKIYAVDEALYKKASEKNLKKYLNDDSFVVRLSPEKLLYLYMSKKLRIPNFDKTRNFFWNYEVMYIDKINCQNDFDKHRHHESFLDILQSEIEEYEDIRDDMVLLFFNVQERDNSLLIGNSTSLNEFQNLMSWKKMPSVELLSLKTEIVFVDKFKPKYNAVLFHQYLKSKDYPDFPNYDIIDYAINDNITLVFKGMDWFGGLNGNCLVYCKDASLSVMKPADFDDLLEKKFIESVLSY